MCGRANCALVRSAGARSTILCWCNGKYLDFDCEWILGEGEQDGARGGTRQGRGLWVVGAMKERPMRGVWNQHESVV